MTNPVDVADKIVSLVEDGLRLLDRTIATWPREFRAIIWEAVVEVAQRRAAAARYADHAVDQQEGK